METALNCYRQGIAQTVLKQHHTTDAARTQFEQAATKVLETHHMHVVSCVQILKVALEIFNGKSR